MRFCTPGGSEETRRATTGGSGWSSSRVKALLKGFVVATFRLRMKLPEAQAEACDYAAVGIIPVWRA